MIFRFYSYRGYIVRNSIMCDKGGKRAISLMGDVWGTRSRTLRRGQPQWPAYAQDWYCHRYIKIHFLHLWILPSNTSHILPNLLYFIVLRLLRFLVTNKQVVSKWKLRGWNAQYYTYILNKIRENYNF